MAKVFKHVLMRIAGMAFSRMHFNNTALTAVIMEIEARQAVVKQMKEKVSSAIHTFNQALTDAKQQQRIQNLRKALYKGRTLKPEEVDVIQLLPAHLQTEIAVLQQTTGELETRSETYLSLFKEEEYAQRKCIKELMNEEIFLKGISLASHILNDDIRKLREKNLQDYKSSDLYTEKTVLKYLSRMSAKTSPFSTFTSLNLAGIAPTPEGAFVTITNPDPAGSVSSFMTINNIMLIIWKEILIKSNLFGDFIYVKVNSTFQRTDTGYSYLINLNNVDYFRRVDASGILDFLIDIIISGHQVNLTTLIEKARKGIDASEQEMRDYLNKCIDIGFIEIDLDVHELSVRWGQDLKSLLAAALSRFKDNRFQALADLLDQLNGIVESYETLSSSERVAVLKDAHDKTIAVTSLLSEILSKTPAEGTPGKVFRLPVRAENLFFEDTVLNAEVTFHEPAIQEIGNDLFRLYRKLDFFEATTTERIKIFEYFREKYGLDDQIPLAKFYEDFYTNVRHREKLMEHDQNKHRELGADEGLDAFYKAFGNKKKERDSRINRWCTLLLNRLFPERPNRYETVMLDETLLDEVNEKAGIMPDLEKQSSFGAFIQFGLSPLDGINGSPYAVINAMSASFGKMHSRFLHCLPGDLTDNIVANNISRQPPGTVFAELVDGSVHNANLHPPLMPFEISFPGGYTISPEDRQIGIMDLVVKPCRETGKLRLFSTKHQVYVMPFDLGFQAAKGRSSLFQLLALFSNADQVSAVAIGAFINEFICPRKNFAALTEVLILPRIVYNNRIILQRRTWIVPLSLAPVGSKTETPAEYFYRLNIWRKQHGIPAYIFLRLTDRGKLNIDFRKEKFGQDNYKPLYINLDAPVFASLFENMVKKGTQYLIIEEMLPDPEALMDMKGDKYVAEAYLQVDN